MENIPPPCLLGHFGRILSVNKQEAKLSGYNQPIGLKRCCSYRSHLYHSLWKILCMKSGTLCVWTKYDLDISAKIAMPYAETKSYSFVC